MNAPLISSGLAPYEYQDDRWSPSAMARDEAGFKAQGDRLGEKIDSGDFDLNDICVFTGFAPSRIRAMVKGCDRHDAMAIDAAIRSGIQAQSDQLGSVAHLFIDAVVREFGAVYAEAAE